MAAPFLDESRLSFEIWKAPRHLLDVQLAFFAPSLMLPTVVDHMSLNFGLSAKISAEIVQKHFLHRNALCVSLQKQALSASKWDIILFCRKTLCCQKNPFFCRNRFFRLFLYFCINDLSKLLLFCFLQLSFGWPLIKGESDINRSRFGRSSGRIKLWQITAFLILRTYDSPVELSTSWP